MSDKTSDKRLLPCTFCGGEVELKRRNRYGNISYVIICKNEKCFMNTPHNRPSFGNKEDAIEQWNTRKPMQEIVERLEEAKVCVIDDYTEEYEDMVFLEEAIGIVREAGGMNEL